MVDSTKRPETPLPVDKDNLIGQIDELENLLAEKKAEARQSALPRLNVGTDGIPILVKAVTEKDLDPDETQALASMKQNDQMVNDIIDKIDKEISKDLDELIVMLKDSIIDEVKTRLLKELHINDEKK